MRSIRRARAAVCIAVCAALFSAGLGITTASAQAPSVDKQVATLYAAAKKEGRIQFLSSMIDTQFLPTIAAFKKRFPGIRVSYVRLASAETMQRFSAEFSAKAFYTDVMTAPDLNFLRDNVGKAFVPLNKANLPGGFPGNYPKQFVFDKGALAAFSLSLMGLSWNSQLVSKGDVPSTFEEALDPRFSGKITSANPVAAGATGWEFWDMIERTFGPSYLTRFRDNKPIWAPGFTQGVQALAAGSASLMIMGNGALTAPLKARGAPVETMIPAQTGAGFNFIVPTTKAPHPNAARLFTWFFLQEKNVNDLAGVVPGYGSPWGGGGAPLPKKLVFADSVGAAKESRRVELAKLLGLKY